jgi:AraC-like DNA-binding protein/ketosteroid isomerase-like protein
VLRTQHTSRQRAYPVQKISAGDGAIHPKVSLPATGFFEQRTGTNLCIITIDRTVHMIEKIAIENLVNRYQQFWQQSDIDGLMSMYDEDISYHDMPSGDVMRYQDMRNFLTHSFAAEQNQSLKLKDSPCIEGNSAFIHWEQSFSIRGTERRVNVNGVEFIVFRHRKIVNIHEFYDFQVSALDEVPTPEVGSHSEKMTKLGLDEELVQKIAKEIQYYFDDQKSFLEHEISLTGVSEKLGYTRNQVSYVINQELGKTFYDLVNSRRIDYVTQQLHATKPDVSILELSINAGFKSVSGFYTAFKKHTSMTPVQYQRTLTE